MGPALARQVWEYFHPDEDGPGHDGDGESETSADALVGAGAD
jgi:hypothetical protein